MSSFMNNPYDYEGGEFDLELSNPERKPRYETFKFKKVLQSFFSQIKGIELDLSVRARGNQ